MEYACWTGRPRAWQLASTSSQEPPGRTLRRKEDQEHAQLASTSSQEPPARTLRRKEDQEHAQLASTSSQEHPARTLQRKPSARLKLTSVDQVDMARTIRAVINRTCCTVKNPKFRDITDEAYLNIMSSTRQKVSKRQFYDKARNMGLQKELW